MFCPSLDIVFCQSQPISPMRINWLLHRREKYSPTEKYSVCLCYPWCHRRRLYSFINISDLHHMLLPSICMLSLSALLETRQTFHDTGKKGHIIGIAVLHMTFINWFMRCDYVTGLQMAQCHKMTLRDLSNKIVDHTYIVEASPAGSSPTTPSFST